MNIYIYIVCALIFEYIFLSNYAWYSCELVQNCLWFLCPCEINKLQTENNLTRTRFRSFLHVLSGGVLCNNIFKNIYTYCFIVNAVNIVCNISVPTLNLITLRLYLSINIIILIFILHFFQ